MEALEENNDNPIDNDMMKVPVDADDGTDAGSKTETESRNIYTFDVPGLNKKPIHRDPQLNEEELHQPLVLISSAHSPQFEHSISLALDDLCPPLESSSFLEEKAIRIALSVGTSAVVLESNQSARIARLALQKRLLLTAEDTEDVFGNFKVPFSATA